MSLGSTLQIFSDPINPSVTSNDMYNLIISTTTFSPFAAVSLCRVAGLAETFPSFPLGGPFLPDVPGFRVPSDSVFPLLHWPSSNWRFPSIFFSTTARMFSVYVPEPFQTHPIAHRTILISVVAICFSSLTDIGHVPQPQGNVGRITVRSFIFIVTFLSQITPVIIYIYIKCFKINVLLIIPSSLSKPMFVQGAAGQSSNPLYAKDTDVCVPNVVPTTWQTIRTDESMIETVFKSEVNFTTAYSGYSTRKIIMEERNVYCGAYNVLMLMEKWVTSGGGGHMCSSMAVRLIKKRYYNTIIFERAKILSSKAHQNIWIG